MSKVPDDNDQFDSDAETLPADSSAPAQEILISLDDTPPSPPPKSAPQPVSLPNHQIGKEIGRGGVGCVRLAKDTRLGRSVAIKTLLKNASESSKARFEQEARVLARLEHPNIVPIHETGVTDSGQPFYSMKLVRGETLQTILKRIREDDSDAIANFPLNTLLNIFQKVCDAVAFAHHEGIIHRDLKPDNIMVGAFGEVLVMDWGLAKVLNEPEAPTDENLDPQQLASSGQGDSSMTMDGQILGTPLYMAPEQAEGSIAKLGPTTDIYSLGGILQAILTLKNPFEADSLDELLKQIKSGDRSEIPVDSDPSLKHCKELKIPASLASVTAKAMAPSQQRRYSTAEALSKDVSAYLNGFATSVESPSLLRRLHLFTQRHTAASLAVMLGITGMAYTYLFSLLHLRKVEREMSAEIQSFQRAKNDFHILRWAKIYDAPVPDINPSSGFKPVIPDILAKKELPEIRAWLLNNDRLATPPMQGSLLEIINAPSASSYTLKLTFEKFYNGAALAVLIPTRDRHAVFLLDARRSGTIVSLLETVASPPISNGRKIRDNDPHELLFNIDSSDSNRIQIKALLDDQPLLSWEGSYEDLAFGKFWNPESNNSNYIGSLGGNWLINAIEYKEGF